MVVINVLSLGIKGVNIMDLIPKMENRKEMKASNKALEDIHIELLHAINRDTIVTKEKLFAISIENLGLLGNTTEGHSG